MVADNDRTAPPSTTKTTKDGCEDNDHKVVVTPFFALPANAAIPHITRSSR
jgi:hypothetical protein